MEEKKHAHVKLGEFFSTAICGNDILSSALYVSGIASIFAGVYAPLVLMAVALVLFFYRTVYREVVEALPVNGGAYNALLNGTSKTVAAMAGVMTILSYIATAVISAKTAVEYLFKFIVNVLHSNGVSEHTIEGLEQLIMPAIILVLFAFALLVISGVKDSAKVAGFIFAFHIITLIGFIIIGFLSLKSGATFNLNLEATKALVTEKGGLVPMLFFAFCASLLGVSGFESSANFVEEQEKGVFKKTLRNMLIGVAIFNPLIALVVLNVLPLQGITDAKDFLLAEAAVEIGKLPLLGWIAIDAFMVLCGAVLTSYVGVTGLVSRMSLDDCLPTLLSYQNKKGSYSRIIILFFVLCASILIATKGDLLSLAGVYTISFLGVMTLFALGNLILRQSRTELKRPYKAPILFVIIALLSTLLGLIGNAVYDVRYVGFFLIYFIPAITIVLIIIYKKDVLYSLSKTFSFITPVKEFFYKHYQNSTEAKFYAFVHHTNRLHGLLDYINRNENGWNLVLVHCSDGDAEELEDLKTIIPQLKKAGVYPDFKIEFKYMDMPFGPEAIEKLANEEKVNKNRIFIGSIHNHHEFDYDDLGGVRIVF